MVPDGPRQAAAGLALAVHVTLVPAAWPAPAEAACLSPVAYRISEIDPRFGLSRAEVRAAISDAEAVWERAAGRELFRRDPQARLTVSLVYDERQRTRELRAETDARREAIQAHYVQLTERLDAERQRYEAARRSLESRMRAHNQEVSYWNRQGGAPPADYRRIQTTAGHLRGERDRLVALSREINALVSRVNEVADRHNQGVEALNQLSGHAISIGEFAGSRIRIFSFEDGQHLRLVLAHELGHALALGHVDDPAAIMYFKPAAEVVQLRASQADLAEFARVCGP